MSVDKESLLSTDDWIHVNDILVEDGGSDSWKATRLKNIHNCLYN